MLLNSPSHLRAVLLALFVTFLWSTSWVLIKIGLQDIPALTFAGLRYMLAFACLLPFALRPHHLASLRALPRAGWFRLGAYGLLFIAVAQGAQFLGLAYLPAITVSLLLNFTPVVVAVLGIAVLAEHPTRLQWGGVTLYLCGILLYFYPALIPEQQWIGIGIVIVCVLTNAISSVMGRGINRDKLLHPLLVTAVSMGIGSAALLGVGAVTQGIPTLAPQNWAVIGWLAVVNTALAFPIWNHTLRTLTAVESSIINSTMLVQIAALAWLFLGETITLQDAAAMLLVGLGTLVVQLRSGR